MGANRSVAFDQVTLAHWGDYVAGLVRGARERSGPPVVLAGHSRGQLVIGERRSGCPISSPG